MVEPVVALSVQLEAMGESAILIRLEASSHGIAHDQSPGKNDPSESLNPSLNRAVHALTAVLKPWLSANGFDSELTPAYHSVLLSNQDPFCEAARLPSMAALQAVAETVAAEFGLNTASHSGAPCIEIPVCYALDFGLDLPELSNALQLSIEELIARHTAPVYSVAVLGFQAGFPYLLGLDPELHHPRRATPRERVPAGSVAIGGAQTGIYPNASPGGWQIIGRTPWRLFDPTQATPNRLNPGDRIRFIAITRAQFEAMQA